MWKLPRREWTRAAAHAGERPKRGMQGHPLTPAQRADEPSGSGAWPDNCIPPVGRHRTAGAYAHDAAPFPWCVRVRQNSSTDDTYMIA